SRLWSQVQSRHETARAPALLHEEMDLTFRVVRDLFSPEVEAFLVDTDEGYAKVLGYANTLVPQLAGRVKGYGGKPPIFEDTGEAVRQIRLRDLGGIIILDFIDMERAEHREQVSRALKKALADDKAR